MLPVASTGRFCGGTTPANTAVGFAGGIAALIGARSLFGEEVWSALAQNFERIVLNTVGRAGLYIEESVIPVTLQFTRSTLWPQLAAFGRVLGQLGGRIAVCPVVMIHPDVLGIGRPGGEESPYL